MTRNDWVRLLSALILSTIIALIIRWAGAPDWAVGMTFALMYFTR